MFDFVLIVTSLAGTPVKVVLLYGGTNMAYQQSRFFWQNNDGGSVVVGTPGRVNQFIEECTVYIDLISLSADYLW